MNSSHYKRLSISFFNKVILSDTNKTMKDNLYSEIYSQVLLPEIANVSTDEFESLTDLLYIFWKRNVIDFDIIITTIENELARIKNLPVIKHSRSYLLNTLD